MAFTEAEFLKLQEEYYPSNKEQDNELSPEVEASPDPLSATQDGYQFEREAKLTGDEEDYEVETLTNAPIMAAMRRYMYDRFDEDGKQSDNETDKEFYDRFMDHYRYVFGNTISATMEQDYLRNASFESKQDFGTLLAHTENNAPSILNQSTSDIIDTVKDNIFAEATDPSNLALIALGSAATGGVGGIAMFTAKRIARKEAIKKALTYGIMGKQVSRHMVKGVASYAALSGSISAVEDTLHQEIERQAQVTDTLDEEGNVIKEFDPELTYDKSEVDLGRVATAFGVGAAFGSVEGGLAGRAAKKSAIQYINNRLFSIGKKVNYEKLTTELITKDPVQGDVTATLIRSIDTDTAEGKAINNSLANIKKLVGIDAEDGVNPDADDVRAALDQVGSFKDADPIIQAQLRTVTMQKMGKIAADIIEVKTKAYQDASKMGLALTDDVLMKLIKDAAKATQTEDKVATGLVVDVFKYIKDRTNQGIEGIEEVDSLLELSDSKEAFAEIVKRFADETFEGDELYNEVLRAFSDTATQAGRTLQAKSRVGYLLGEYGSFTKEQRKALKDAFGTPDGTVSVYEGLYGAVNKFGRVRRSLMTVTPATTVRNVFSGLANITFATGANTIESIIYNMAKVASDKNHTFGKGLKDIWLDSSGMLVNLISQNRTAGRAFVDASLVNHPTLMRKILRNNAEFGEGKNLPEIANFLNGLNIASDGFFRRSLFSYELDKRFRRAGIDGGFKGVMLEGKSIPTEFLEMAGAETLKGTFSYTFKKNRGAGEGVGATFVDFIEKVPFGTVVFPFARFMANAIAFQYQYSPLNTAMGAMNMVATATANMGRKNKTKLDYAGLNKAFSRGTVGTAALYAAIQLRLDQQENPYWKVSIGGKDIDSRPFFPLPPYLLLADFVIKTTGMGEDEIKETVKNSMSGKAITSGTAPLGMREVVEGIAGFNWRATGQLPMFDALFGMFQKDTTGGYFGEDKTGTAVGEFVSAYLKTPFVGLNFVKDVMASFDQNEAVIRDTKAAVEGTGFKERALSAAGESFKQVLPVRAQEALGLDVAPVREYAYRKGPAYRQSTLAKQTTGARIELPPTDVQAEMEALGMPEWQRFKPSGDRVADSYMRKAHNQHMLGYIRGIMYSPEYQSMSKDMRSEFMNNTISVTKKEAKDIGEYFNMEAIVSRLSVQLPELEEEFLRMKDKNPKKAKELLLNYYQQKNYVYTGPFPRSRWMGSTAKRTKAVVNQHLKVMYNGMKDSGTLGDSEIGIIMTLAADKYGEDNLTIENTGLYALGHELGKAFKSGLKP